MPREASHRGPDAVDSRSGSRVSRAMPLRAVHVRECAPTSSNAGRREKGPGGTECGVIRITACGLAVGLAVLGL
ncbi:hypothetical protein EKN07_01960 [Actinobaculum sp. 352]|nr:hypothetical protein EKN07_01960 [Actinobaculum sp. 352]